MFYRSIQTCLARGLPVLLATIGLALGVARGPAPMAAPGEPADTPPRLQVVLLNGGGQPASNFYSHLLHVKQLSDALRRAGISPTDIAIFNADGADPTADFAVRDLQPEADFWLLRGTRLERPLRPPIRYENSVVDGFTLQPATHAALRRWFEDAAQHLRPGDTLLFYVTDHGTKNAADLANNRITLWGEHESLSVTELRELFAHLDPGVRVVVLMSQCYSGGFANLMDTSTAAGLPAGNVCGFFSSTADRQAYGCYPENRDKDNVGHSFAFIASLAAGDTFPEAHNRVLVIDQTPDVPLTTSDIYLERLLEGVARGRGQELNALIDEFLVLAWRNKGAWEPEIRLLDRIGQAFGSFSPRSMAELQEHAKLLPDISEQFTTYGKAWEAALHALTAANLERFLASKPHWQERLEDQALASLEAAERRALAHTLLSELADFTHTDTATNERLQLLHAKADSAAKAYYRMQVRLGVVLRMRAILTSIAGRVYLTQDGMADQRQAYEGLTACEALAMGDTYMAISPPAPPEPFPAYDEERKLAEAVLPGWMGIRFKQADATVRAQFGLKDGASTVQVVYPDSPAQQAGLEVGDIILGPPDAPFTEPQQIREWIMTAPIGRPTPLQVLRGEQGLRRTLTPQRYPIKWPSLPGPPTVGSEALPLRELTPYRGTLPVALTRGGPYLLFFWATWCAPCKASLPEVVAFERDSGIPVVAITDEPPAKLDAFFTKYAAPFPAIVAVDALRRSFLAYGVSGTPTFVLADAAGKVQSVAIGYRPEVGLTLPGWSWTKRTPAPVQESRP
jgi:thiol-disulfide isomerase/thioredoxin